MGIVNQPDDRKPFRAKLVRAIVARGRARFLVLYSLAGSVILWGAINLSFVIRGAFDGNDAAYVILLEALTLFIIFPFALAMAYYQWRKFEKIALVDGLSAARRDAAGGQDDGAAR